MKFGAQMQILLPRTVTRQGTKILQIQDGGRPPYWKSFFGYISTIYCPINAKFSRKKHNHVQMQVTWPKYTGSRYLNRGNKTANIKSKKN